jgi:signal transduction histidine kinase
MTLAGGSGITVHWPNRLAAALERFDLGIEPTSVPIDAMRRIRIIGITTIAMCLIGVAAAVRFWKLGLPDLSLALVVTMAAALGNLALLRWARRPVLSAHLALALLAVMLVVSNASSGGFHDPNFAWFYVLPLGAAVLLDLRGAGIWLGVTLAIAVGFWSFDVLGSPLPNRIPEEMRQSQDLFNRVTAILGLCFIAASFVIGQRRAERGLEGANAELRRETAYVQLLEHAAVASNEAASLDDAMREGVRRICLTMGWPGGHIYAVEEDGILRTARVFHVEEAEHFAALREKTLRTTFRSGEGVPGRAAATGLPQGSYDLPEQSDRPRAGLARKLGLHTAFAIPVLVHGRAVAVLEFATRERMVPNERLLEVLAHVGVQIGRVAERTALQQRLRQSQKMEAVGRLAAGVAHEVNNPMAYVRSNLNQLRNGWTNLRADVEKLDDAASLAARFEECEELIEESLEGVERTVAIARDMKEFSRAGGSGRDPADLRELVEGALRVACARAPSGLRIERQHDGDLPSISCAANQIRQVLVNLIVNAIEAVGGAGTIRVVTRREGQQLVVRVEDDGPGMTEETRERLFDPFFTTKAEGEGTGLGLAISYEIVHGHGGEIRVPSTPGSGTAMEVCLPIDGKAA